MYCHSIISILFKAWYLPGTLDPLLQGTRSTHPMARFAASMLLASSELADSVGQLIDIGLRALSLNKQMMEISLHASSA